MESRSCVETVIAARPRDIGGFLVRRVLPFASHRMVGPFIFFDHMGPAELKPGEGMDVRPHPHINLATVTYLFEGKIQHKDSLGSDLAIEPGAINWMTAGKGIVHSERTPEVERKKGIRVNGIQLWVALPEEFEETAPTFSHHPKESLPEFQIGEAKVKLLLGNIFDRTSPVKIHSDLFYAEIKIPRKTQLHIPTGGREAAIYVVDGNVSVEGQSLQAYEMLVAKRGSDLLVTASAEQDARLMLIGGHPVGERFIYWNFVSSSKERLEEAKKLWSQGPTLDNPRFHPVPGDDQEFVSLPT